MFQDEARFGRMVRIRRCWAQKPMRPTVCNGYEREFLYVYGAVSPMQGQLDWMIAGEMNTVRMTEFLAQVTAAHRREFIVMVVDGAVSVWPRHLELTSTARHDGGHDVSGEADLRAGAVLCPALAMVHKPVASRPAMRRQSHQAAQRPGD